MPRCCRVLNMIIFPLLHKKWRRNDKLYVTSFMTIIYLDGYSHSMVRYFFSKCDESFIQDGTQDVEKAAFHLGLVCKRNCGDLYARLKGESMLTTRKRQSAVATKWLWLFALIVNISLLFSHSISRILLMVTLKTFRIYLYFVWRNVHQLSDFISKN